MATGGGIWVAAGEGRCSKMPIWRAFAGHGGTGAWASMRCVGFGSCRVACPLMGWPNALVEYIKAVLASPMQRLVMRLTSHGCDYSLDCAQAHKDRVLPLSGERRPQSAREVLFSGHTNHRLGCLDHVPKIQQCFLLLAFVHRHPQALPNRLRTRAFLEDRRCGVRQAIGGALFSRSKPI